MKLLILGLSLIFSLNSYSYLVEEGYFIFDSKKDHLKLFRSHSDLTIDHPNSLGYEVYGPLGLGAWLKDLELSFEILDEFHETGRTRLSQIAEDYPSPEKIANQMKVLEKKYPKILKLTSIGNSEEGRPLWLMKISDNVNQDEIEPEVKLIGNMHGNEIVGREVLFKLIENLSHSYGNDPQVTSLINNTEIFILPSMNPDGAINIRRGNSSYVDLNRDFPDFTTEDNENIPVGRASETMAVMNFQKKRNFALSANFHGGALVVNYPWDTERGLFPLIDLVKNISINYANLNSEMRDSTSFPGGITNGYDWYEVDGGMQDWSYYWHNDLQITVEISNEKYPSFDQISSFYKKNKEALMSFLRTVHQGIGFSIPNSHSGTVDITHLGENESTTIGSFRFNRGEFFKTLSTGKYKFQIKTDKNNYEFLAEVKKELIYPNGNFFSLGSVRK